jgi:hypothetical protein
MADYSLVYNAQSQTFVLTGVDGSYVEYNADELTQTEAGVYYVTVSLKSGSYAVWDDKAGGTDSRRIEFVITKKAIEIDWNMSTELPYLDLHGAIPNTAVTYKYYDSNGNQVATNALKEGVTYTIKAVISDEYAKNYMFGDSSDSTSEGKSFTYTKGDTTTTSGDGESSLLSGNGRKWLTIIAIILLVLCLIGILLWLLSTRRRHDAEDRMWLNGANGGSGNGGGSGRGGSGSGGSGNGFQDDDGFYDDYIEPKG